MTRRIPKSQQKKRGRKTVMTNEVLTKLEVAFANGLNDTEACMFAGIQRDRYYIYVKKNPAFLEKKELLQGSMSIRAKFNISKKLEEGDVDTSKWWLERRSKKEFSTKIEMEEEIKIGQSAEAAGMILIGIQTGKINRENAYELLGEARAIEE